MTEEENVVNETAISETELHSLLMIRHEKLAALQAAGCDPFLQTTFTVTAHSGDICDNFEAMEGMNVSVAGRIMSRRLMGKASFFDIADIRGRIQCYIQRDVVGEDSYDLFKQYDIGDIAGVKGTVFKTKTDEVSIKVSEIVLLAKSLQMLPEKFHGLRDTEARYRQRYVDLIMNGDVKETFLKRTAIIKGIRRFLDGRGYIEVETPILVPVSGGGTARPFVTHHNALNIDMPLRISLELPLKRLIIGGLEKVYEIGRVFRNEGVSVRHYPEFTMLELYEAYTDLSGMMELTESLINELAVTVTGGAVFPYMDWMIDTAKPFEKITMTDAVKKYSGVDFCEIKDIESARAAAKTHGVHFEKHHGIGGILECFFDKFVEPNLIQPTFLTEYPVEISPLAKRTKHNPDYAERFELFIGGREYCNAYTELNDPIDQRSRFEQQEAQRNAGNDEAEPVDEDFLLAMEYGMPPTGGLGIGVDRLVMLLTNSRSIRDQIYFPTLKPAQSLS